MYVPFVRPNFKIHINEIRIHQLFCFPVRGKYFCSIREDRTKNENPFHIFATFSILILKLCLAIAEQRLTLQFLDDF